MFKSNKEMVYTALMGWKKWVETGDFSGMDKKIILMLANGDRDMQRVASKLPQLTTEQVMVVKQIEDLAIEVLNGKGI